MRQVYLGGTLINDVFLGADRMDDVLQEAKLSIDWLLVGGGGSGGNAFNTRGGGGGAGRFVSSSLTLFSPTTINVTIGLGGQGADPTGGVKQGNDGGTSTAVILGTTYTAPGGGGGGLGIDPPNVLRNGRNGGSGGGSGGTRFANSATGGSNVSGDPIAGFGNNGESRSGDSPTIGGNGGGAGGTPTGKAWLDGITYCTGGSGTSIDSATEKGDGGRGGLITNQLSPGMDGVFKLRYLGTPKATGGTITQSDGYTYHTFTSNGTFTY
jgi:hypothetical protein